MAPIATRYVKSPTPSESDDETDGDAVGCSIWTSRTTDSVLTFSKLLEQSDEQLFSRVVCSNHCLIHLLEKDKSLFHMSLRPRGHSFDLPIGINTILPGNLLSIETYIHVSENRLPCVLRVRGAVCTMCTLGGLSLLTTAYIRFYVLVFEFVCVVVFAFIF